MDPIWLRLIVQRVQLLDELKYKPDFPVYLFSQTRDLSFAELQSFLGRIYQLYPKQVSRILLDVFGLMRQVHADDLSLIQKIERDIQLLEPVSEM